MESKTIGNELERLGSVMGKLFGPFPSYFKMISDIENKKASFVGMCNFLGLQGSELIGVITNQAEELTKISVLTYKQALYYTIEKADREIKKGNFDVSKIDHSGLLDRINARIKRGFDWKQAVFDSLMDEDIIV